MHRAIEIDRRRLDAQENCDRLALLRDTLTPRSASHGPRKCRLASKRVAAKLGTTLKTVKGRRARVMRKMGGLAGRPRACRPAPQRVGR